MHGTRLTEPETTAVSMMRQHTAFLCLLGVTAVAWFTILLASQTHVHSDEAIIGLMGKHILEGRYLPLYMYGQPYNAGAAWEAYLAAIAFALFGIGVIPLKSCILLLSLICLILFYAMCRFIYDTATALLGTTAFALCPTLLKWHFQVRGYSWYFLSIPILTTLFFAVRSSPGSKPKLFFFFGLAAGLSIWSLELAIPLVAALSMLLIISGNRSLKNAVLGAVGFVLGYAPAIAFNFTHHFANWRYLAVDRPGGGLATLFQLSTCVRIFFHEIPKFFGPDTVLWYYPEEPLAGWMFYAISVLAVARAVWLLLKSPLNTLRGLHGDVLGAPQKDVVLLILALACFLPYLTMRAGVPSYFFGGCFFLSALTGRLLKCWLASSAMPYRLAGTGVLAAILIVGIATMVKVGRQNQIETLTWCDDAKTFCMTRIPATDIEGVEAHLRRNHVTSVWTTISFVYPLLFESGESLAVSNSIFEYPHRVYPRAIPWREPSRDLQAVFVLEKHSPFRAGLQAEYLRATGNPPAIAEYAQLAVIEAPCRDAFFK
ncbi:MAG: ArnT family glycosyltransferase [Chthoniobacterales bacterium]